MYYSFYLCQLPTNQRLKNEKQLTDFWFDKLQPADETQSEIDDEKDEQN